MKNLIYILLIINILACSSKANKTEEKVAENTTQVSITAEQLKMNEIVLGKIEMKNLSSQIQLNGMLDVPPQNLVSVSATMGGFVRMTELLQGMKIHKGQVLAILENQDLIQMQLDYLDAKSRLEYLTAEYQRQQELSKENVSALKVFQQTTADFKSLQAKLSALEKRLELVSISAKSLTNSNITGRYNLYSPVSGYVTVVNVNIGKFVNPVDVLFEIADTEHLHAELTAFEKDIQKIKVGQKVNIQLANETDKPRTAKIYLVNHKIEADRTVRVHAHLEQEDNSLIPSTFLKATIEVGENKVSALPESALVSSEAKDYIFILKSQKDKNYDFEMVEVKKGITEKGYIEITLPQKYQSSDNQVVTKGAFSLLAKLKNTEEE